MAENENGQERSEAGTPKRLQKAREEGQTARSRELVTAALVGIGALGLWLWFPKGSRILMDYSVALFRSAGQTDAVFMSAVQSTLGHAIWVSTVVIGPLLILLALASIAASGALGGYLFSTKVLAFKAERLSPAKGLKRIYSSQAVMELFKSIAKFLLISGVAIVFVWKSLNFLFSLALESPFAATADGLGAVVMALLLFALVLALIASIDVPWQIAQHRKQLKMTKQEVKDEMRDSEGKPEIKSAIRRAQLAISQRRMLQQVPTADVVITNPEHFAIALRYVPGAQAPLVVASGADHLAMRIRELAKQHRVPQLRLPTLARAIFFHCKVGDSIPVELYAAVAQVLAYIAQLRNFRRGGQNMRPALGDVSVPRKLQRDSSGRSVVQ